MGSKRSSGDGSVGQAIAVLGLFAVLLALSVWAMSLDSLGPGAGEATREGTVSGGDDEATPATGPGSRPEKVAPGGDERRRAVEAAQSTEPDDLLRESNSRLLGDLTAALPSAPEEPAPRPSARRASKVRYDDLLWPDPPGR